jgi:nanoRNase/pAp phosphatase (c-di-AMP/oligoRNAs hydrolase)
MHRLTGITDHLAQPTEAVALVDTQPGAGNNALLLFPESPVAIVLDHHPLRESAVRARFADVRPDVGATSTILTEYLRAADIEPSPQLATALFYGIKTDTMGLGRGAGPADVDAYFYLQPRIDIQALVQIERAQVPLEYFQSLSATLQAAHIYDGVVISYLGPMRRPDMAAEMADLLPRLEGARWVICMGTYGSELILSVRTDTEESAGRLVQRIVGKRGSAGGHGMMAGGQIPLRDIPAEALAQQLIQEAMKHLAIPATVEGARLVEPAS